MFVQARASLTQARVRADVTETMCEQTIVWPTDVREHRIETRMC